MFRFKIALVLLILILSATPFSQLPAAKFVDYDDSLLIYKNPAVLNFDVKKIFLSFNAEDYLPLTTLTFAIENSIVGLDPYYYHLDNIILHLFNVTLVFLLISLLVPETIFLAALTALLFGIHPLHVESVAWVSQRKDVLSTFFFLLSLIFYIKSTKTKDLLNFRFYTLSFLFFIFSISSKFMAVSLPGILVLLELYKSEKLKKIALRTFPYITIMIVFSLIHLNLHDLPVRSNAEKQSLLNGLGNGINSLSFYITKSVLPFNLSAFYEKNVATSGIVEYLFLTFWIAAIGLFLKLKNNFKLIIFLNLFFLATIFPVLQIIPFGNKFIFADRFMYLPSVGLFGFFSIMLYKLKNVKYLKNATHAFLSIIILGFSYLTYKQTLTWKDSKSLWSHGISIYPNSSVLNNNLANEYLTAGETEKALTHLKKAIELDTKNLEAHINLSTIYMDQKNYVESINQLQLALEINPRDYNVYFNLGSVAQNQNDLESALKHYQKAIDLNNQFANGYLNFSSVLYRLNRKDESLQLLEKVITIDPNIPEAHSNLGFQYYELGRNEEAIIHLKRSIALDPKFEQPHRNLALIYLKTGNFELAQNEINQAISIQDQEKSNPARQRRN